MIGKVKCKYVNMLSFFWVTVSPYMTLTSTLSPCYEFFSLQVQWQFVKVHGSYLYTVIMHVCNVIGSTKLVHYIRQSYKLRIVQQVITNRDSKSHQTTDISGTCKMKSLSGKINLDTRPEVW